MKTKMPGDNDINDICDEFGIEPIFVRFTWGVLQKVGGKAPGSNLVLRNLRECALACCVTLAVMEENGQSIDHMRSSH